MGAATVPLKLLALPRTPFLLLQLYCNNTAHEKKVAASKCLPCKRAESVCLCLQHVTDFFVTSANAALSKSDEPEKVGLQIICTCPAIQRVQHLSCCGV